MSATEQWRLIDRLAERRLRKPSTTSPPDGSPDES
jgi:hypothetical protein